MTDSRIPSLSLFLSKRGLIGIKKRHLFHVDDHLSREKREVEKGKERKRERERGKVGMEKKEIQRDRKGGKVEKRLKR